jgi:uncharacterized Zn finger protein (UPF0148 family)
MICEQCDSCDVVFYIERGVVLCQACQEKKDRQEEAGDHGSSFEEQISTENRHS